MNYLCCLGFVPVRGRHNGSVVCDDHCRSALRLILGLGQGHHSYLSFLRVEDSMMLELG
jgi:hypothetical protein